VNNISYDSTEEKIKSAFEPFGQILDVRIIYDKVTNKPKGYCYVEFAEEESLGAVMENKNNFFIDGRRVMVKTSQSVIKIRENIKFVAHVTNLPFSLTEEKLKEFLKKNEIDRIIDCLITKDESGNSKGFGFVEFEDEDSLKKSLLLTGKMLRGRPVTIKMSTRNITRTNKRKASNDLEGEIDLKKKPRIESKPG
jgi:polyadenylate-binding protein